MRHSCIKILLLLAITACSGFCSYGLSLKDIAERMRTVACYNAHADYEVLMPNLADPVNYAIELRATEPGDSLAPCKYIINWTLTTPVSSSEGFSAYFDGAHFRFRDRRMQEYHIEEGVETFAPGGDHKRGVQYQVQFAELLPAFLADHFEEMAADSTYSYTITEGKSVKISGMRRVRGYDSVEFEYVLDLETLMPQKIELENNPGQISEQTVYVIYSDAKLPKACKIDLSTLTSANSEAFEKYRSNFLSLEQLPGNPLPQFSTRTLGGERFTHDRGQATGTPTLLVFLDAEEGSTPGVIEAVRVAVDSQPTNIRVIWAFMNRREDTIASLTGPLRPGETVLVNATYAARECGVGTSTPVLIYVDSSGNVTDFTSGFNQDLQSVVIEKAGLSGL